MTVFNEDNQPNTLSPTRFREFALHIMSAYFVDLTQPHYWSQIARADGKGLSLKVLARELAPICDQFGAVLTPKLLNRIVQTFRIHGPELDPSLTYASGAEDRDTQALMRHLGLS